MEGTSLVAELPLSEPEGTLLLNEKAKEAPGHQTNLPKILRPEFKPWRMF